MSTTAREATSPTATATRVVRDMLAVTLSDGREIRVPLAWYPRLEQGSAEERANWELVSRGIGIHWPGLDEHISIEGIVAGRRSGESPTSLARWLKSRTAKPRRAARSKVGDVQRRS